jgi:hypothetical protein
VAHHERTLDRIAETPEDVLRRIYLLFQQYKDLPDLPDIPNKDSGKAIHERLTVQIRDLRILTMAYSRERDRLQDTYRKLKIQSEVLKQLMGELSSQEGNLFDGLIKLNSILRKKMRKCGPEKQLDLHIKIEKNLKEIAVYEEFLKHELLKIE